MVLQNLSVADVCRCMAVSKTWNMISRHPSLWVDLKFVKHWTTSKPRPLSSKVLNDIIINRTQKLATSLAIHSMRDFGIDSQRLGNILKALPKLESLSLHGYGTSHGNTGTQSHLGMVLDALIREIPPGLKSLQLGYFEGQCGPHEWETLPITPLAETLQELVFTQSNCPTIFSALSGFKTPAIWPKLEKLEFRGCKRPIMRLDFVSFAPI